jgi:hypothetical protein
MTIPDDVQAFARRHRVHLTDGPLFDQVLSDLVASAERNARVGDNILAGQFLQEARERVNSYPTCRVRVGLFDVATQNWTVTLAETEFTGSILDRVAREFAALHLSGLPEVLHVILGQPR